MKAKTEYVLPEFKRVGTHVSNLRYLMKSIMYFSLSIRKPYINIILELKKNSIPQFLKLKITL